MTVIAYDGKIIAADKAMVCCDMMSSTTKIFSFERYILAYCGSEDTGRAMVDWYHKKNHEKEKFPSSQSTDNWSRLIVFDKPSIYIKELLFYEQTPFPTKIQEQFAAFGSGRDFAIGAMAQGANAIQAVEIAIKYCVTCGMGIDAYNTETMEPINLTNNSCGLKR